MTATRPRGLVALGLVTLLVLLAACTREPAAPQQPPLTLPSGPSTSAAPAAGGGDWTTYHRDNARTGYRAGLADPTRLPRAWSTPLDGAVYGQPLVVGDRVLVATEAESLYALEPTARSAASRTSCGSRPTGTPTRRPRSSSRTVAR
jgi:polyvinyl alcohol dehydrogenase (cytochrome)